jgi:hypothetical protein
MKEERVNITEYYDKDGICRKRTANGIDLPPDTEPSIFIMQDIAWVEEKRYMTKQEFKNKFPHLLT